MLELPDIEAVSEVLRSRQVRLLVAFGSRVRGAARSDSDLDIGVERCDGKGYSYRELGRLQLELSRWSGCEVDLRDLASADVIFRFEVAGAAQVLYEDRPGRWTAFVARTLIDHDDAAPFLAEGVAAIGRAARGGGRA